nr:hypothetical protein [Tanacetum cinerariifolium]
MGELTFFLGLQVKQKDDGIFISQNKYVADILKKFDFTTMKTASTQMEPNKALIKDAEAKDVDVHLYRSMIRSLMYLTASRPDIMFAPCAKFQVTPKTSHLHIVKRIFRYLKGQPKLGLWYPRDSPFDLEAFFDSDYARASLDRKSTIGEETIYKEWEGRMEMDATTTSSLEAEQENGNINRTQSMTTLNEPLPQGTGSGSGLRTIPKISDESSKRAAEEELEQECSKRQKTKESLEPREKEDDELIQKDLQKNGDDSVDVRHRGATTTVSSLDTGQVNDKQVLISEGSPVTTTETYMETYKNVSQDIRDQLNAKAEALQIILTGIDNDIYSTIDAYPNACEMWKAIERLKQGESINVQDLETNLYWEFGKFTSQDGESLELYYSRFYKMMNESQELKTVSYHKLYDILKHHQNEVNEIKAKRISRTANPLALVAQQKPVYHPQNHPTHYTQNFSTRSQQAATRSRGKNSSTRSQQAATRNRGKAIVNSSQPISDQEPSMVDEDDETHVARECQKPKKANDAAYHREKMLLCLKMKHLKFSLISSGLSREDFMLKDCENLDKMKEKDDACIFMRYSAQSRAYRVFNKRTRVTVETIHVNFDELPQMASDHASFDPAPECQRMALDHDSLSPSTKCQENVSHAAETVTTSNELDLLFSLMFAELLNGSSQVVSKSSAVNTADAPNQRQQHNTTPLNNQTTHVPTCQAPTQAPNCHIS